MTVGESVIWQVIKKNNAFLVKRGRKGEQFTKDPLSITNRFNASDSGLSNYNAISISATTEASKSNKASRRVFNLNVRHGGHHSAKKTSGAVFSKTSVKKEVNRLVKVVNSLQGITEDKRQKLLNRVYKLHAGTRAYPLPAKEKKDE
ncbi:unnamed protein product [Moneuplotes crassus]|uniref:Ribosomal eL28/Mak16 domain-containing protein n=1 Tax=Euplotes crassus TaxID=5936 RepID=A0A7S3P192_EUPCR|nr:unnamed protein product [Moneuplotes crassus]|mmetsp:Transcript_39076/g.38698  ORF Transcript_39076/g.38698 Transcript_39076/m.38698 type:complete len:147 (+) Transcript_39076:45-485(+)|eukprot:CAMPEP_0196999064 /NCGR_PEP_ID=MMETSP1380-20130617/4324_1 /TAXON_ID=5936 /ORGANISM="Euplotes crassus, Strain CT5" /LENGTH=146 /DNA_ID=CAMNT_0042415867 /DNA_START=26 /DNA_END=466 /DNA_ORIENTATION=-